MRIRTFLAACAVAAATTLCTTGLAAADTDRDCADFATQADAQAALEAKPGDPERLDDDGDGVACESQFESVQNQQQNEQSQEQANIVGSEDEAAGAAADEVAQPAAEGAEDASAAAPAGNAQIVDVPAGGVDTGDGSASGTTLAVVLGGLGAAAVGAVAAGSLRRRPAAERR